MIVSHEIANRGIDSYHFSEQFHIKGKFFYVSVLLLKGLFRHSMHTPYSLLPKTLKLALFKRHAHKKNSIHI